MFESKEDRKDKKRKNEKYMEWGEILEENVIVWREARELANYKTN